MTARGFARITAAVLIAVAASGCSDDGGTGSAPAQPQASSTYVSTAQVPAHLHEKCPPGQVPLRYPDRGELASGAVAVRLCNAPEGQGLEPGFQAPADLLTTDTESLVDLVNEADSPPDRGRVCFQVGGPTYVFWFLYPDGDARAVAYDSGGCGDLKLQPHKKGDSIGDRTNGAALLTEYSELLLGQRAERRAPASSAEPRCNPTDQPQSGIAFPGSDLELTSAVYCPLDSQLRYRPAVLDPEQVELINEDYQVEPVEQTESCPGGSFGEIRGYTGWGDRIILWPGCGAYFGPGSFGRPGDLDEKQWKPSAEVLAMLDGLALGHPQVQRSSQRQQ